jgi:hypothetical protein
MSDDQLTSSQQHRHHCVGDDELVEVLRIANRRAVEDHYQYGDYGSTHRILINSLEMIRYVQIKDNEPESTRGATTTGSSTVLTYDTIVAANTATVTNDETMKKTKSESVGRSSWTAYSVGSRNPSNVPKAEVMLSYDSDGIYDGAFLLTNDIPVQLQETCATLLFNLALVHHKLGLTRNNRDLWKAEMLYHQVIQVLEASGYMQTCVGLQVMIAAAYHNIGQIYLESPIHSGGGGEAATQMFQKLHVLLVTVHDMLDRGVATGRMTARTNMVEDLKFFNSSLYCARLSIKNRHAAAA